MPRSNVWISAEKMGLRKTFTIIGALAVGGITIPVLASLIPSAVYAILGVFSGGGVMMANGAHSVFASGGNPYPVVEN